MAGVKYRMLTTQGVSRGHGVGIVLYAILAVLCLFAGVLIGLGQGLIVMLVMAMVVSVVMLAYPVPLMWCVILGALVISGPLELYFPEIRQARWGVSMLGFALIGAALLNKLFLSARFSEKKHEMANPTLLWLGVFFSTSLAGLLYSHQLANGLIGLKIYFQGCGLFLALAWLQLSRPRGDLVMKSLVVIALIQLPFALQQFFFLGSRRILASAGGIASDGVVGTFSGSSSGGGAGPVLSALLILVISILLFWWRSDRLSSFRTFLMTCICLIPVFLNETKISLILIPVALYLVFSDKVKKSPLQFLSGSIISTLLLAGIFMVYINLPAGSAYVQGDASSSIEESVAYNFGNKGYGSFELNRTTVYGFWAKHHGFFNPIETLVGHGLGSSGEGGSVSVRNLATYDYRGKGIGLTTISALLWDVGIIGTFAVVAMFWSAFRLSGKILAKSDANDVIGNGLLMGARVGIAILGLNLIHNNYFTFEFGYQILTMLMFGYVAFRARSSGGESAVNSSIGKIRSGVK